MNINFNKENGLVPAIVQDDRTQQVLMLGYMNQAAVTATLESGKVTFFSRSKQRLWMKGETSGNVLIFKNLKVDCDQDTLLIRAIPTGPVCHKGTSTCFAERNDKGFLYALESIISDRIDSGDETSYTKKMYQKGINKMAQKVGEEAVELVIEAKDDNQELFENEAADLLYHFLLLLKAKNSSLEQIESVLKDRQRAK